MDAQKYQSKLTRTHSSLLRSSSTVRSSIQSLSSVSEVSSDEETEDLEEQKPHNQPTAPPVRSSSARFLPVLAVIVLSFYTTYVVFRWNRTSISENLLLTLIFVAVLLFVVSRNLAIVRKKFNLFKHQWSGERGKIFGFCFFTSKANSKPVQWYIGECNLSQMERRHIDNEEIGYRKIIREGVESYSNGDYYEGEFSEGKYNGSGVYHYNGNGRYEGDWADGKYDGSGVETWARGSRYRGQYRQGMRHGFGVYKFYTGDAYAGEWCNGQSHGIGAQTCVDGSCYIGEFKRGFKHGLGCYRFRNGDRYAGEYFGDKIHGFGVYHFANSHCYEGSWHEGRRQGYGMYTFQSGETRNGEWDAGNLRTPLPPQIHSVLQAVEAARKAAENAIHLRRVDGQVNKAVTAANRASTSARVAAVKAVGQRSSWKLLPY